MDPPVIALLLYLELVLFCSNRKTTATPCSSKDGGRRSRQAKQRADKMRKLYTSGDVEAEKEEAEDDDWDLEADDLYQWTQELSFEDIT